MVKTVGEVGEFVIHGKCGASYQIWTEAERLTDAVDCEICRAVRADYVRSSGLINRASAGTPLAQELGLVVTVGQSGI